MAPARRSGNELQWLWYEEAEHEDDITQYVDLNSVITPMEYRHVPGFSGKTPSVSNLSHHRYPPQSTSKQFHVSSEFRHSVNQVDDRRGRLDSEDLWVMPGPRLGSA